MTHPCTWASNKGRELKLSCPERVMLWQLAERSATKGYCWPSVVQLMTDTGLARQTILTVVRTLAALGLIRIEKDGQKNVYHVLMPVQNKTGDRSKGRLHKVQYKTGNRSNPVSQPVQNDDSDRSKINTLTLKRTLKITLKGTKARDDAREPETRNYSFGGEGSAPPPAPRPAAPAVAATNGGGDARSSDAYLDDPSPDDALPTAEADPLDEPADKDAVAASAARAIAELTQRLRMRAYGPGRHAAFTRNEQVDILEADKPQIKPNYLPDAVCRASRAALAARAEARGVMS